jgi:hypothetical protein
VFGDRLHRGDGVRSEVDGIGARSQSMRLGEHICGVGANCHSPLRSGGGRRERLPLGMRMPRLDGLSGMSW